MISGTKQIDILGDTTFWKEKKPTFSFRFHGMILCFVWERLVRAVENSLKQIKLTFWWEEDFGDKFLAGW